MVLNEFGKIAQDEWNRTSQVRENVMLDAYVIMPNHLHGIIMVSRKNRGVWQYTPTSGLRSPSQTIGAIIRGYKSAVTRRVNEKTPGLPLWQRNYYEHIIRNEDDLNEIR